MHLCTTRNKANAIQPEHYLKAHTGSPRCFADEMSFLMEDSFGVLRDSLPLHLCQITHLLVSRFLLFGSVGRGSEKLASVSSFFRCPWQLAKSLVAKKVLIEKNKHSKNPMNMLKNI